MTARHHRVRRALAALAAFALPGLAAGAAPGEPPAAAVRPLAQVAAPGEARPRLSVPADALVRRGGLDGVFVLGADGRARFRLVKTGRREGARVEILAGLFGGESLVLGDLAALRDGAAVRAPGRP